jgi:two-component system OmpR family sensor kinase
MKSIRTERFLSAFVDNSDVKGSDTGRNSALAQRNIELIGENALLREAVLVRDDFIAVAGHELRNPMTPIMGRVQLLRRMIQKPDFRPEQIEKGLEQLESLVVHFVGRAATLLNVSRMTTGKLHLEPSRQDVGAIVRQVAENYGPIAEYAGSLLSVHIADGGIRRLCDGLALEQILDNLISNAIKYGPGQPILVSAREEAAGGPLVISVQDSGPGMDGAALVRTFAADPALQKVPIAIMSAMPEASVAERCSGYSLFVQKPFGSLNWSISSRG